MVNPASFTLDVEVERGGYRLAERYGNFFQPAFCRWGGLLIFQQRLATGSIETLSRCNGMGGRLHRFIVTNG